MNKIDKSNKKYLKKNGHKKFDYFLLTDTVDTTNLFESTIADIDYIDWKFQKANGMDFLTDKYNLFLMTLHFKALEKESFGGRTLVYGTLKSGFFYILNKVEEALYKRLDKKFPYIFETKYNAKQFILPEKKCMGNEAERFNIETKIFNLLYSNDSFKTDINNIISKYKNCTFKIEEKDRTYFIISDLNAAKNINFKSFFNDFYLKEESICWLDKDIKKLIKKYKKAV